VVAAVARTAWLQCDTTAEVCSTRAAQRWWWDMGGRSGVGSVR